MKRSRGEGFAKFSEKLMLFMNIPECCQLLLCQSLVSRQADWPLQGTSEKVAALVFLVACLRAA